LIGGRLYQWDTGRKVKVSDKCKPVSEVHFSTLGDGNALVVLPYETENGTVANIPNILLQSNLGICVYVVSAAEDGESTITKRTFSVATRPKPEDYIYTETEVLNYTHLENRLNALEGDGIAQAVADYLEENPIESGATSEEAAQIEQNKQNIENLSTKKLDADKLQEAVNNALAQAKESGEFNGDPGENGEDYVLTDADIQEIAEQAAPLVDVPEPDSELDEASERPVMNKVVTITFRQLLDAVEEAFKETASKDYVNDYAQPKGNYALKSEIPSDPVKSVNGKTGNVTLSASDVGALPTGTKIPVKTSELTNDSGFITGYTETDPTVPSWAKAPSKPSYTKSEVGLGNVDNVKQYSADNPPPYPVTKVNGKTGAVTLDAESVGARPSSWTPSYSDVGAEKSGTASSAVSTHNTNTDAHNDIRLLITALTTRLDALANSDDDTLDQMAEVVAYIKANRDLIDQITTGKVSVSDIVNNLITNVANKPLSAAQGVVLKGLIDAVSTSLSGYQPKGNYLESTALPSAINTALAQAKSSGEFDGADGKDGADYSFDPTVYGLPVLYLTGDTEGMSKDVKKTLDYSCTDAAGNAHTGTCTVKWQGNTSVNYEKKNYSVTFDSAFEARTGWGEQKKYCFKANFIDHTHCRNVVSAKLWGKIRKNRSGLDSKLKALPNAGAIDGFPAIIMLNGEFHGVYTWNIPKDQWMFGMGSGTQEAILMAHEPCDPVRFKAPALVDEEDFEMEFVTDEANSAWVATSVNNLINACINSYGADLDTTIAQYLDWESAIDYYIFTVVIDGRDITSKNYILATYDGAKWFFSAYDLDTTYGLRWAGQQLYRPDDTAGHEATFVNFANAHRVFELIKRFKTNELKARYTQLRKTVLHELALAEMFENFAWAIPSPVLVEDVKKYPSIPGSAVNNVDQILRWLHHRLAICDEWINALPAQEEPVLPEVVDNWIPVSTDASGAIYNGTGYKNDIRMDTSNPDQEQSKAGMFTTGFIPVKKTDVIRVTSSTWATSPSNAKITFYNSSFKAMAFYTANGFVSTFNNYKLENKDSIKGKDLQSVTVGTDGFTTLNIAYDDNCTDVAYCRYDGCGSGANAVVKLN
jgi:ABC-type amino acid transport substrate-binding protein